MREKPKKAGKGRLAKTVENAVEVISSRLAPRVVPQLGWQDPVDVLGTTEGGGSVFFPLNMLSHVTSRSRHEDTGDPQKAPAVIHLRNGDFYTMAEDFATWVDRLRTSRANMLQAAFDVANTTEEKQE